MLFLIILNHNMTMKNAFQQGNITASILGAEHWSSYRDFCAQEMGKDHLSRLLDGKDPQNPDHWRQYIMADPYKHFGLFHDGRMVGMACIAFQDKRAVFTGILIDPAYRNRGLANSLHDIRKRYLQEINFTGPVTTKIWEQNQASIAAAERNGFFLIGKKKEENAVYKIFALK